MVKFAFEKRHLSLTLLASVILGGIALFALSGLLVPSAAAATVTLYTDCNYLGGTYTFSGNIPDFTQYGGLNDALSSLRVPAGYVVTIYQDINYQGSPDQSFLSDNSCLVGSRIGNDNASSMTIYQVGQGTATLFADCSFSGSTFYRSGAVSDFSQTPGFNDVVSSLRVPAGYLVILYSDANYQGNVETFGQDQSCFLGTKIGNDQASSMVVVSAPRPTAWDRNESALGWGVCNHYWGNCPTSAPYWDGGFMDQNLGGSPNKYADAVSVLVAFPGTPSAPSSFVPAGNYLALGMVVQSQSNTGFPDPNADQDLANFAMVYLTNSGQPIIVGEVWNFHDANPSGTPGMLWGGSWTCDCFTASNYQNLVTLTMSWSGNTLTWQATIGGVQYTLFSYAKNYAQENLFSVGINSDFYCSCNNEWFQFGVMANYIPGSGWNGYVGNPRYLQDSTHQWNNVDKATWIGNELSGTAFRAQMDHWYGTGSRTPGNNQGDSCVSGGTFPGTSQSILYGQVAIHSFGSQTSVHGLWDGNCKKDLDSPSTSFTAPPAGSWQKQGFGVSMSSVDVGDAVSGVALCFWSVESLNGNWITTLSPQLITCNSTQTVTLGPSGYCRSQGLNSCRVNAWSEDWLGNVGVTNIVPSNEAYTEGSAANWVIYAGGGTVSDDSSTAMVGTRSIKGSWTSAGQDLATLRYPNTGALALNLNTLGNSPNIEFFVKASLSPYTLRIYLDTNLAGNGFSNSVRETDANWHQVRLPVGPGSGFTGYGSGDWGNINYVSFTWDYAPAAGAGSLWFDGLYLVAGANAATRYFSIDNLPPTAPSPQTPTSGATNVIPTPTLTWAASTDATSGVASYTLQLSTSSTFSSPTTYSGITGTSYTIASPLSLTTWYWRVQAVDIAGNVGPLSSTFSFRVTDFTITASSPYAPSVGSSVTSTITVSPLNGFTGTVSLTDSIPLGLTCGAIMPSSITTYGTATVSCSSTTAGTYSLTITGTGGGIAHSTTASFIFPYSFRDEFAYSSVSGMVSAGWTVCGTQSQVSVGNSLLSLTNDGVTAGDTCWTSIPSGVNSWTVTVRGQYATQLGGWPNTNGATWVHVFTPSHQYQFDLDGYYQSYYLFRDGVNIQSLGQYTPKLGDWHDLTLDMRNGVLRAIADGKVIMTYTEVPGADTSLTQVRMMPGWETVTNYDWVSINQVNGAQPADFAIGSYPMVLKVNRGTNAVSTVNLSSLSGFTGTVSLTATISPSTGLTCSFNPASVSLSTTGTSTMTCSGSVGTYTVTVRGTSGSLSHTTSLTISVITYTLTFQGYDYDGGQEVTITVNNQQAGQVPAVDSPQNAGIYVGFSVDITSYVVTGTNTVTFTHANWDCSVIDNTKGVQITDSSGIIVFSDPTVRPLSCTQSITYTFTL